jgi:hypothetical protein
MGVTRSLFEGLVTIPDEFVPPWVLDTYGKNKLFCAWQSTMQNRLSLGIPTLALARHSLMTDLKAHDAELGNWKTWIAKFIRSAFSPDSTYILCVHQSMNSTVFMRL